MQPLAANGDEAAGSSHACASPSACSIGKGRPLRASPACHTCIPLLHEAAWAARFSLQLDCRSAHAHIPQPSSRQAGSLRAPSCALLRSALLASTLSASTPSSHPLCQLLHHTCHQQQEASGPLLLMLASHRLLSAAGTCALPGRSVLSSEGHIRPGTPVCLPATADCTTLEQKEVQHECCCTLRFGFVPQHRHRGCQAQQQGHC